MRRVWRLGQTKPVKVIFPIYDGSMEAAALALMGQKMQAALLLYGDNAASAITDEAGGSGDFTAELAAKILEGEDLSTDGITGLLKHTIPDEDDNPTWESLDLEDDEDTENVFEAQSFEEFVDTWQAWTDYQQEFKQAIVKPKRRKSKAPSENQLTLFAL